MLLAKALLQAGDSASEIEDCLRRSLVFNGGLFDAADMLASLMVQQRRYDDAEDVISRILPRMSDPSPARGRLAWIHRQRGRKEEALEEMAASATAAPWALWGWDVLMDWLREDRKWEMART
ncbi:MAG: hypothetical protein DMG59_28650, partial [Acidobacteria bacterium]